jgi:predicted metal-binding membrane protein
MSDEGASMQKKRTVQQVVVGGIVIGIALAAWAYVLAGAGTGMSVWAMTTARFPPPVPMAAGPAAWSVGYAVTMAGMWSAMMVAMMLPAALLPLLGQASGMAHGLRPAINQHGAVAGLRYLSGTVLPWLGFSLAATGLQFALEQLGLLHGRFMWSTHANLTAILLAAAGLYQFTQVKSRSLAACSLGHSDPTEAAGMPLGVRHGSNCVVRCGPMMLLLFAGGTMNLVWIAGLAAVSLAEPLDSTRTVARLAGAAALAAAVWVAYGSA